jgi:nucleotide-binding universal stress UspA family protein
MGLRYLTGHAPGMAMNGTSGPVVCGIGAGDPAGRVATFAAGLADALGAPLMAVRIEAMRDQGGPQAAVLRDDTELNDALSEAERVREAVTCTVKVADSASALVAVAEEKGAQLLVVGAGRSGTPLSSVSRELAMRATCPVVVIPHTRAATRRQGWQRGRLLCAFDGSDDARPALGVAAAVAERLGTAAFVVHMRPGSVDDLRARAHAEQAALVVASSRAAEGWRASLPQSAQDAWAPIGPIPLLLVPPAYRAGGAPPVRGPAEPLPFAAGALECSDRDGGGERQFLRRSRMAQVEADSRCAAGALAVPSSP